MTTPAVKFATTSDDVRIAYSTWGEGPTMVLAPPIISNVEVAWESEYFRRVFERLGQYLTVIAFDKRGIGLSEPFDKPPNNEHRMLDFLAVMDAEGVERAHVSGLSEGGAMAQIFAVAHRDRVDRLVLANTWAPIDARHRVGEMADHPLVSDEEILVRWRKAIEKWGEPESPTVSWVMPSRSEDDEFLTWHARFERQSSTRSGFVRQLLSFDELDTRGIPEQIDAPTLITHTTNDQVLNVAHGRALAELIPGSKYMEFAGADHFFWVAPNWRDIIDSHLEFLTESHVAPVTRRSFATVLFTDLVDSTASGTRMGDEHWAEILDRHDRIVAQVVAEHEGRVVKTTGDGVLATFAGPSPAVGAAAALRSRLSDIGLQIRAGIHAGEIEDREGDVSGFAVNLAARVEGAASPGEIYVTSTVRDLLIGGSFTFEDAGAHNLKGLEGKWRLCRLV